MQLIKLSVSTILLAVSTICSATSSQQPLNALSPSPSFNPRLYPKKAAHCGSINRASAEQTHIDLRESHFYATVTQTLTTGRPFKTT